MTEMCHESGLGIQTVHTCVLVADPDRPVAGDVQRAGIVAGEADLAGGIVTEEREAAGGATQHGHTATVGGQPEIAVAILAQMIQARYLSDAHQR